MIYINTTIIATIYSMSM